MHCMWLQIKRKSDLTQHIRSRKSERTFSCHECGVTFKWCFNLKQHMATHTDERYFQCDVCGGRFNRDR